MSRSYTLSHGGRDRSTRLMMVAVRPGKPNAAASDADWGSRTAMNLPVPTTTLARMVDALARVARQ